jgi:hypothetical protein
MSTDIARSPAPASRRARPRRNWRRETLRLAAITAELDRRRDVLDRLGTLVSALGNSGLWAVAGEEQRLAELRQADARASAILRELPRRPEHEVIAALDELEKLLHDRLWELADQDVEQLEAEWDAVQNERTALDGRLVLWRLQAGQRRAALIEAERGGVVDAAKERVTGEIEDLVKQADQAVRIGAYGLVGVTLERLDQVPGKENTHEDFLRELAQAREEAGNIVQRAELLLIKSEDVAPDVVEYTVMLRMPRTEAQGVNLHSSSVLVRQDRAALRRVVDRVSQLVDANVRTARRAARARLAAGGDTADEPAGVAGSAPAAAPAPADRAANAAQTDGITPLRRFVVESLDPAEPLTGDLEEELRRVGGLMYRLLLPDLIQRLLDESNTSIVITTNDLELPWELLHDDDDFLSLKRPTARVPLGQMFPRRRRVSRTMGNASTLQVLLVGSDPYDELTVEEEIRHIKRSLENTWGDAVGVTDLVGKNVTGSRLNDHLRSGLFHVIHYAGHAAFDSNNAERSRLVLADGEPCFAQKIQRILEGNPLVFLNACESSSATNQAERRTTTYLPEETQGLASAFIYGGAAACVGSLWPVFDDTAAELATEFYQRLFEGHIVGRALGLARKAVRERLEDRITWAAYALYGDPLYRLPVRPVSRQQQMTMAR